MKYVSAERLIKNRGCYSEAQVREILAGRKKVAYRTLAKLPSQNACWLIEQLKLGGRRRYLLYADIAEHVLPLFERGFPDDDRPRRVIEASRKYAREEIGLDELHHAYAAAYDAAYDATTRAAYAAYDAYDAYVTTPALQIHMRSKGSVGVPFLGRSGTRSTSLLGGIVDIVRMMSAIHG